MQPIKVKYCNGQTALVSLKGISLNMGEQIIKEIHAELVEFLGEYEFKLTGVSGDYKLKAYYRDQQGKRQSFTESFGRTPSECLRRAYGVKHVLKNKYGWVI